MKGKIKWKSTNYILDWLSDQKHICGILLLLGLILKMFYAIQVPYDYSPHDLGTFSADGSLVSRGHLSYIQYLYLYKKLPDTCFGQFYQPPLFYIIGAVVLGVNHGINNYSAAFEGVQLLNMFFSSVGIIYGYSILRKIGKKDWFLVIGTAFLSFCPAFYIIGAEMNNDSLATMFLIMALYYTLCWREKQNVSSILKIALCIGLGMLTKTNVALIAFAVGLCFLYMLIKNRAEWKRYIRQFCLFGIICIPLGMGWNVYRLLKYDLPLTYIPRIPIDDPQYIGNVLAQVRLGLPSVRQLTSCSIDWDLPVDFSNIWGQTFLTMNFDEGILSITGRTGKILANLLLWVSILLTVCLFILLMRHLFSSGKEISLRILFPINFLIILGNYIKFAFDYPYICTMNFRYIVIVQVVLIGSAVICHNNNLSGKIMDICLGISIVIQSILSTYLYLIFAI